MIGQQEGEERELAAAPEEELLGAELVEEVAHSSLPVSER